jgi:hypothetical protein
MTGSVDRRGNSEDRLYLRLPRGRAILVGQTLPIRGMRLKTSHRHIDAPQVRAVPESFGLVLPKTLVVVDTGWLGQDPQLARHEPQPPGCPQANHKLEARPSVKSAQVTR